MRYPSGIDEAVASWLEAHGRGGHRAAAAATSQGYSRGASSAAADVAAYLVARAPATYAAVRRVLSETAQFQITSVLDIGAGPGTASWAALGLWPDLARFTLVDRDARFLTAAKEIAAASQHQSFALGHFIEAPLSASQDPHDLVLASYVLAEMEAARAADIALHLWKQTAHTLAIIEPGTPRGFERVKLVRDALLAQGATIIAPCTHHKACPMAGDDWCHFAVRLARSREHMHAKNAVVPFEDEPFSYLIASRHSHTPQEARILRPPVHSKVGLDFRVCTNDGAKDLHVASREKALFKRLRKLGWGDTL